MYDELVKQLRCLKYGHCPDCPMWYSEEVEPNLWRERCAAIDAADAIEELLQKTQQMPRWIPVTERLPKEGEFVLVYGDLYPNKHDGGVIAVSKRMDWNYWQGFGRERNITHWMPLPEPPKEET